MSLRESLLRRLTPQPRWPWLGGNMDEQGGIHELPREGAALPVFAPAPTPPPVVMPAPVYAPSDPKVKATVPPYSAESLPVYAPSEGARAAAERLRAEMAAEVKGDRPGSAAYGASQALANARGSDSVGYLLGAAIGGGVSGLIDDKLSGRAKKAQKIEEAKNEAAVAATLEKAERDRREQEADIANKENLPVYRTEEQRRKDEAEKQKAKVANQRALASVFNRLEEFDPENPENAAIVEQFEAAGVPVVKKERGKKTSIKQDAKTGALYVVRDDGTSAAVTAPSGEGQLAITSPQAMTSERAAEALASRERVAQWRIAAQKEIAAQNQAIQRDRVKMSADQFSQRYPGAGKVLTAEDVAKKAAQLKMLPEDVARDAVKQGYVIQ